MKTIYLNNDSETEFIKNLKNTKQNFTLKLTNYSTTVLLGEKRFIFTSEIMKKKTFICFNKIRADIKNSNFVFTDKLRNKLFYYSMNERIMKNKKFTSFSGVINIDINSAYLTVLKNNGIITKKTFNYIQKCSKSERLKSVGMLATQSIIYEFKEGKENTVFLKSDENLRNIFFLCCYEIDQLLFKLESKLNKNFLFFWFDGIYFRGDENKIKQLQQIIKNEGFESKVDFYNWVTFQREKNNIISLKLDKNGKIKNFNIPLKKDRKKIN